MMNKSSPCRQYAKGFFYPDRTALFAFTLFSITGINFFAELADNEVTGENIFFGIGAAIGFPLYLVIDPILRSAIPVWSYTMHNEFFLPVMIPIVFGYLYLLSCSISHLWRRIRAADSRQAGADIRC